MKRHLTEWKMTQLLLCDGFIAVDTAKSHSTTSDRYERKVSEMREEAFAECPSCPLTFLAFRNGGWKKRKHPLRVIEQNANGERIDVAVCEECGKGYLVYYAITKIERHELYDGQSRLEYEESERKRKAEEKQKRIEEAKRILAEEAN